MSAVNSSSIDNAIMCTLCRYTNKRDRLETELRAARLECHMAGFSPVDAIAGSGRSISEVDGSTSLSRSLLAGKVERLVSHLAFVNDLLSKQDDRRCECPPLKEFKTSAGTMFAATGIDYVAPGLPPGVNVSVTLRAGTAAPTGRSPLNPKLDTSMSSQSASPQHHTLLSQMMPIPRTDDVVPWDARVESIQRQVARLSAIKAEYATLLRGLRMDIEALHAAREASDHVRDICETDLLDRVEELAEGDLWAVDPTAGSLAGRKDNVVDNNGVAVSLWLALSETEPATLRWNDS